VGNGQKPGKSAVFLVTEKTLSLELPAGSFRKVGHFPFPELYQAHTNMGMGFLPMARKA
jgi:hypothetical protein